MNNKDKKTILVTGGAGYIGSFTVKGLLNHLNNYQVVVLDNLENGHLEAVDKRAIFELADLSKKEEVRNIFQKYKIDAVIDFAAYTPAGESMEFPEKFIKNNVFNFVNLLDVMQEFGCKNIIKSSTAAVYGNPLKESDFPLREDYTDKFKPKESSLLTGKWGADNVSGEQFFEHVIDCYNKNYADQPELALNNEELVILRIPASVYGLTKLLDEIILDKFERLHALKYIALRYFNVCGADPKGLLGEDKPNPSTLMTLAIYTALGKNEKLKVFGNDYPTDDGTCIRDYIHPLDLASGHLAALESLLENQESNKYNLGVGKGYSVLEVIHAVKEASGKKVNYSIEERRAGDPTISIADPSRANEILGWQATQTLTDMANSAWLWHSAHLKGYEGEPT